MCFLGKSLASSGMWLCLGGVWWLLCAILSSERQCDIQIIKNRGFIQDVCACKVSK